MAGSEKKNFNAPDETRPFQAKGKTELLEVGGRTVARVTFEPGWRWSEHVKPLAGTDSCQFSDLGYVLSGRMHLRMDDGKEADAGPGDAIALPSGHDAEIVGSETCVILDFGEVAGYAKQA